MDQKPQLTRNDRRTQHLQTLQQAPRRLLLGVLIMLISGGIGGLLWQGEKRAVEVWAAVRDVPAGAELLETDVVRMSLPPAAADTGLKVAEGWLPGRRAAHQLLAGEILTPSDLTEVPASGALTALALPSAELPATIRVGDAVDVWLVDAGSSRLVAAGVAVVDLSSDSAARTAKLTLRVPPAYLAGIFDAAAAGQARVVRQLG